MAEAFAYRSTCLKRKYGAVIVKDDVVVSTGYNGSPEVIRTAAISAPAPGSNGIFIRGRATSSARAIHAEQNALLNCSREQTLGADLYLAGVNPGDNSIHRARPCPLCARLIIQAGIKNVILRIGPNAGDYEIVPAKGLVWHF